MRFSLLLRPWTSRDLFFSRMRGASRVSLTTTALMFLTRSEYGKFLILLAYSLSYSNRDRGVNTFSPEGRLFQGTRNCIYSQNLV